MRNEGQEAGKDVEENGGDTSRDARRRYEAPRIAKKRPVSRATLFTGSGPSSGGVVAQ